MGRQLFCVLVCGGRDYADREHVFAVLDWLDSRSPITRLVHGGARGADRLAAEWAHSKLIPVQAYPGDWSQGRSAGPRRNEQMLADAKPNVVVAFPGGKGTAHMEGLARKAGLEIWHVC